MDTTELLLSEQFEAIQNQTKLEGIAEIAQHLKHTVSLTEIPTWEITPEIYSSLMDFEKTMSAGCG